VDDLYVKDVRFGIFALGPPQAVSASITVDNMYLEMNELNTSVFNFATAPVGLFASFHTIIVRNSRFVLRHLPTSSFARAAGININGARFAGIYDSVFSGGQSVARSAGHGSTIIERCSFENLPNDKGATSLMLGAFSAAGSANNTILRDISLTMLKSNLGGDGIRLYIVTNVLMENIRARGAIATTNSIKGSFVSIGFSDSFVDPTTPRTVASVILRDSTFRAMDNETVSISIRGIYDKGDSSAYLKDITVHGGLAGVLLADGVGRARLENVHVTQAIYGIAVAKDAHANVIKDSSAAQCCVGLHADNTTRANVFQDNIATECAEGYDDQGTNLLVVDNTAAKANTEFGSTGASCATPSLNSVFGTGSVDHTEDSAHEQYLEWLQGLAAA
jgi:hypothetical protein